eukprot:267376-Rhodomonas_salina.2
MISSHWQPRTQPESGRRSVFKFKFIAGSLDHDPLPGHCQWHWATGTARASDSTLTALSDPAGSP